MDVDSADMMNAPPQVEVPPVVIAAPEVIVAPEVIAAPLVEPQWEDYDISGGCAEQALCEEGKVCKDEAADDDGTHAKAQMPKDSVVNFNVSCSSFKAAKQK